MQYETEGEAALFDESTNPSLDEHPVQAPKKAASKANAAPAPKREQKGEDIPEEEPEQQMA